MAAKGDTQVFAESSSESISLLNTMYTDASAWQALPRTPNPFHIW
jgi:hypothetical protein